MTELCLCTSLQHIDCLLRQVEILAESSLCLPRYFFQVLQSTSVKVLVSNYVTSCSSFLGFDRCLDYIKQRVSYSLSVFKLCCSNYGVVTSYYVCYGNRLSLLSGYHITTGRTVIVYCYILVLIG